MRPKLVAAKRLIQNCEGDEGASPIPYHQTQAAKFRRLRSEGNGEIISLAYKRGFSITTFRGIPSGKVSFVCYTTYEFLILVRKFLNLVKNFLFLRIKEKVFLNYVVGYFLKIFSNRYLTRTARQVSCLVRLLGMRAPRRRRELPLLEFSCSESDFSDSDSPF
jgi:hypothetical protein